MKSLIVGSLIVCFYGLPAWSQKNNELQQRSQEQERRAQEALEQRQKAIAVPDVRLQSNVPKLADRLLQAESPCFPIRELKLQTESPERWSWLLAHADGHLALDKPDPVQGQCVGAQGVQIVMDRLQNALIAQGYVTSRVLTPAQNLQTGQLTLQLLPGRIQEVRWAHGSGQRGSRWNTVPMARGDVLNLRDIEQALENYKRVPTAEADIDIQPAQEPGFSDVVIRHEQALPFRISASIDDSGTRSTGQLQGSLTLSYDNWWTLSDLFYVTLSRDLGGGDPGNRGTRSMATHYSVPFGYWLVSFNASRNRYFQTVAGATQDYLYSGKSQQQDIKLTQLFARDAVSKTSWSIKAFARQSENFIDDTEVEVQRRRVGGYELGVQHKAQWGQWVLDGALAYKRGTKAFGANEAPEELFGEGTHQFKLWTADFQWQTPFAVAGKNWNYQGNWRWQENQTPLTPQDRFSIGGRFTVRGFDGESSLAGESGWLVRNELSTALAQTEHRLYLALDHGHVSGLSAQNLVGQSLTGFVLGFKGKVGALQYDVFAGTPVKKPQGFRTANTTAGISLTAQF